MRTAKITIASKTYTVEELPRRKSAEWRARLRGEMSGLVQLMENAPDAADAADGQMTAAAIIPLATAAVRQVLGSIDTAYEMLLEYAPELARDRERIDEAAYDSEVIDAFMAVLGLAYPFGAAAGRILALMPNGSPKPLT